VGCLVMLCLPCFSFRCVVLIARLHLCQKRDLLIFIQVAAAAMVGVEVVFHAYSAADRAKIDDGMKRHGISALLLGQPSAQVIIKVCCVCGLWLNYSIMYSFTSLYLTRSAS
jgi:hypothetical protein